MIEKVYLERTETGYTNIKAIETAIKSFPVGKRLVMTLSDKSRRSSRQNDYFHSCCGILGKDIGYTKDEVKSIVKMKFLKREKVDESTGEVFEYLLDTHSLNKEDFAEFMEQFIQWAAELGTILPSSDDEDL